MDTIQTVWRYRYIGESPCSTQEPNAFWNPGDEHDVSEPINNVLFVPVVVNADTQPAVKVDGDRPEA